MLYAKQTKSFDMKRFTVHEQNSKGMGKHSRNYIQLQNVDMPTEKLVTEHI
jgi:hypothetical protein